MPFLRTWLERLLKVSIQRETSAKERHLEKRLVACNRSIQRIHSEHAMEVKELTSTIERLQESVKSLQMMIGVRDKELEKLEHDKEILQIDVKGMTSVNARLTKWIESLRTAEERPTTGSSLKNQLENIENSMPWEVS